MGLTGIITIVTLRVMPVETPFIRQVLIAAPNLDALFRAFEESKDWTYTVAWTDCLAGGSARGRSIFFRGEHALVSEVDPARTMPRALELKRHALPLDFPSFTMNHLSARAFNELTWQNGRYRQGPSIIGWDKYFFPLDAIANWNRVYGRRGFVQHQFVVPKARGRDALGEVLSIMAARNAPACLAVLKLLGPDEAGMLSFPMEGYTLAVDFPATPSVLKLLDELDAVVLGVSRDAAVTHAKFRAKHRLPFTLLVDADHAVAEKYGAWREKTLYGKKSMGIVRSTFVIGPTGRVARVFRSVKPDGHAEQVLAVLEETG